MSDSFKVAHRVEFRDTDAAGIMHFSTFVTYMEESEHAFLRSLGLSVLHCEVDGMSISWPRVSVNCDFSQPLKFEDEFEVYVSVDRLGTKSLTYGFRFVSQGRECARGAITAVCCRMDESGMESIEIPQSLRERLTPFVGD